MNKSDFRSLYPWKLELHAHTKPVSPCSEVPPEEVVQRYHAMGYDGIAITNHFNLLIWKKNHGKQEILERYYEAYLRAKAEGDRLGLRVYFGMEIRFSENANDYLIYGLDESALSDAYDCLDEGLAYFNDHGKKPGMFLAQAHPFRDGMERMDPSLLDGVEAFNMHYGHNSRVALADRFAREHHLPILGGTDFHHPGQEGLCAARVKELPEDSFALAKLIASQDFCLEIGETILLI